MSTTESSPRPVSPDHPDLQKWEARYADPDYRPDPDPVPYLVECCVDLTPGHALCLAAGSGRNVMFLASRGWQVRAVDISSSGLRHCEQLAIADRFSVETVQADLTHYELGQREFDLVTMIYYLDTMLFSAIALALRPGGHFLFHTFGRDQARRDWGPSNPNFLACGRQVLSAFDDWQIRHFAENDVERSDGRIESVVQMLARKPGLA